jgi:hypothetical protein
MSEDEKNNKPIEAWKPLTEDELQKILHATRKATMRANANKLAEAFVFILVICPAMCWAAWWALRLQAPHLNLPEIGFLAWVAICWVAKWVR